MKQRPRIYYSAEQKNLMWDRWQAQKTRHEAGFSIFLVAGACYENYMQIEIEPFPLVA